MEIRGLSQLEQHWGLELPVTDRGVFWPFSDRILTICVRYCYHRQNDSPETHMEPLGRTSMVSVHHHSPVEEHAEGGAADW